MQELVECVMGKTNEGAVHIDAESVRMSADVVGELPEQIVRPGRIDEIERELYEIEPEIFADHRCPQRGRDPTLDAE